MPILTQLPAWRALWQHFSRARDWSMRELFDTDPQRAERYWLERDGLILDYSKNRITDQTLTLLLQLAREAEAPERIAAMFRGEPINTTEHRAVLHVALRSPPDAPIRVGGEDIMPKVTRVLDRMSRFAHAVRSGDWLGYTHQPITDIVSIGIGGSDLGPLMVCEALKAYAHPRLTMHFVSNVDSSLLKETLKRVHAETTLFIIESKTFTTSETLTNAHTAREWFLSRAGDAGAVARHFVAVSTNQKAVADFGIDPAHMFEFWDWVGGRYSLWSAIGLPIMLCLGEENFRALLAGAHDMDTHFRTAPLEANMPVLLALVGIWYINFFGGGSHVIAPYDQYLHRFPAFIQQLDMESNGKQRTRDGRLVDYETAPIIWGGTGINGQHAFFQLLHQGTHIAPIDLIASLDGRGSLPGHHEILLGNMFAQAEAFLRGKTLDEARAELRAAGLDEPAVQALAPFKVFDGNRPTNTLLLQRLDPRCLGALIALYEHKIFVQGAIWQINSFDQWGVELGKQLAHTIVGELDGSTEAAAHDSSTARLIALYRRMNQEKAVKGRSKTAL